MGNVTRLLLKSGGLVRDIISTACIILIDCVHVFPSTLSINLTASPLFISKHEKLFQLILNDHCNDDSK